MTRLGLHLSARLALSIGFVIVIMFGLTCLIELIPRLAGGDSPTPEFLVWSAASAAASAAYYTLEVLPVYVLVGAILALIEMQRRFELVVMKSAGCSIWRLIALPVGLAILAGLAVALVLDPLVLTSLHAVDRDLRPATALGTGDRPGWLSQTGPDERYFIHADQIVSEVPRLVDVSVFAFDAEGIPTFQLHAAEARLDRDHWVLTQGTEDRVGKSEEAFAERALQTGASPNQVRLALGSAARMSYYELAGLVGQPGLDEVARFVAEMRLARLQALPLVLVGSLLIAFAFTSRYRREGTAGTTILYGILLGFVVFVVVRLAEQAGSAGLLDPTIAAWGPAIVASVIGLTALLNLEDG